MPERTRRGPRPLTLVCQLLVEQGAKGQIVGRVEVVNTGEAVAIANVVELVELVERCAAGELDD